jgi:hypothetical protein
MPCGNRTYVSELPVLASLTAASCAEHILFSNSLRKLDKDILIWIMVFLAWVGIVIILLICTYGLTEPERIPRDFVFAQASCLNRLPKRLQLDFLV